MTETGFPGPNALSKHSLTHQTAQPDPGHPKNRGNLQSPLRKQSTETPNIDVAAKPPDAQCAAAGHFQRRTAAVAVQQHRQKRQTWAISGRICSSGAGSPSTAGWPDLSWLQQEIGFKACALFPRESPSHSLADSSACLSDHHLHPCNERPLKLLLPTANHLDASTTCGQQIAGMGRPPPLACHGLTISNLGVFMTGALCCAAEGTATCACRSRRPYSVRQTTYLSAFALMLREEVHWHAGQELGCGGSMLGRAGGRMRWRKVWGVNGVYLGAEEVYWGVEVF